MNHKNSSYLTFKHEFCQFLVYLCKAIALLKHHSAKKLIFQQLDPKNKKFQIFDDF